MPEYLLIGEVPQNVGLPVAGWKRDRLLFFAVNDEHAKQIAKDGNTKNFKNWKLFKRIGSGG